MNMPHRKFQVKPYSPLWFSVAFATTAIAHRNHIFCLCRQNKIKFRQAGNRAPEAAKRFLKLPNLHM